MTREKQIMNFVETQYKKLALGNPDGLTPEGKGYLVGMGDILRFVNSLQKEEPRGLDEAAEKYANTQDNNFLKPQVVIRIFEAGAKWMAGQGEVVEGYIAGVNSVSAILAIPRKDHSKGDEVIVQIRKKED